MAYVSNAFERIGEGKNGISFYISVLTNIRHSDYMIREVDDS